MLLVLKSKTAPCVTKLPLRIAGELTMGMFIRDDCKVTSYSGIELIQMRKGSYQGSRMVVH